MKEHYKKVDINLMSKEQLLIELEKEKLREEFRSKIKKLKNVKKRRNPKKNKRT